MLSGDTCTTKIGLQLEEKLWRGFKFERYVNCKLRDL